MKYFAFTKFATNFFLSNFSAIWYSYIAKYNIEVIHWTNIQQHVVFLVFTVTIGISLFQTVKQFWTLYPHTPDNSFLGFAMEMLEQVHSRKRSNQALIYGKQGKFLRTFLHYCSDVVTESYMRGREEYLKIIGEHLELHSTFESYKSHSDVHIGNHGILNHEDMVR